MAERDPNPSERDLLDAVFGDQDTREAARARLSSAPRGALSLRLIEARLGRTVDELRDVEGWSKAAERSLVQRVLASTTRTGTTSVANGRSRLLRDAHVIGLVAACAAVFLGVLVVVARKGHDRDGDARQIAIDDGVRSSPVAPRSSDADTVLPEAVSADVASVLSRARSQLVATGDSTSRACRTGPIVEPAAPIELRLLQARAKGLREHRWEPWLKEVQLSELGTLALALWCETQLDRYALTGEVPPAWDRALAILDERREEEVVAPQSKRLLTSAVDRARRYGLSAEHEEAPLLASLSSLWTEDWFEDLAGAGVEVGLADEPLWRAWVVWKGGAPGSM